MIDKRPLLSIVIPTKDRYYYLKKLIELIDGFQSDEIELVLQDNTADNTEILEFLKQKEYPYIRYAHNSEQIPISLNSDLAILNSTGKYVCFIGDDDGVTKYIIDCVTWMQNNDIDAVIPSIVSYTWPDIITFKGLDDAGKLSFNDIDNKIIFVNPIDTLVDLMKRGFIDRGNLPLVYHGVVKRSVLDEIYKIGNTFFPGSSPDIANGVALSLLVKKYANINMPLIISGASKTHGGGIRKMKNRAANIEDLPFLPKNAKENWEKNIPRVWTGETVWCESAIKTLRYMDREDLIEKVNFENMYAHFIAFHFPLRSLAYKLSNNKLKLFFSSSFVIIKRYFNAAIRLIWLKLFGKIKGKITYNNILDINSAVDTLQSKQYTFPK